MLEGYHILTLTHREAALESIGQAVILNEQSADVLSHLKAHFGWEELYYLATCNRVQYLFYSTATLPADLPNALLAFVRPDLEDAARQSTAAAMRLMSGPDAIRHFMEVAASMDSLVVGERSILTQLREAFQQCRAQYLTGDHLRLLVQFTVETAKRIYTHTGIGQKALSVAGLAFAAWQKSNLSPDARILLIGAGETNQLFAKFLNKAGYYNVMVFNRTFERAKALADLYGWRSLPLDALPYYTEGFDGMVVCTGATHTIITPDLYEQLLMGEQTNKTVIDLAVPNNADRQLPAIFPVSYTEVEGLRMAAEENLQHRYRERDKAAVLVEQQIADFRKIWHERQVERSLSHIPGEVRAAKERALHEVFGKEIATLDPAAQDLIEKMMDYMEKKCVAIPMKTLKKVALSHSKHSGRGAVVEGRG
jgi:glutamyl-tRNA reductase